MAGLIDLTSDVWDQFVGQKTDHKVTDQIPRGAAVATVSTREVLEQQHLKLSFLFHLLPHGKTGQYRVAVIRLKIGARDGSHVDALFNTQ